MSLLSNLPDDGALPAINENDATYVMFDVNTTYYTLGGVQQIPVAGDDGTEAVFAKWAAPCSRKVVTFAISRIGAIPDVPDYVSADPNDVLLDVQFQPGLPGMMPDGKQVFTIMGMYLYGLKKPIRKTDGYKMGANPFLGVSKAANVAGEGIFKNFF